MRADYVVANEVISHLPEYVPTQPPAPPQRLGDVAEISKTLRSLRAGGTVGDGERQQARLFASWRANVTQIEGENAKRIGSVLFAIKSVEAICAAHPGDQQAAHIARELRLFVRAQHRFEAPDELDHCTIREVSARASKRVDILPDEWRAA